MMSQGKQSAVQSAAMLILLRLCTFLCSSTPFSASGAKHALLTALLHAALILPLLQFRSRMQIPAFLLHGYRLCAAFEAAYLTLALRRLCIQSGQQIHLLLPLLLLLLLYTVRLHERACLRTASLLLFLAAAGFLLLPLSGIGTAQRILLYTPAQPVPPGYEWADACELPFLPLLLQKQTEQAAKRSAFAWAAFRILFLPALILFGTMQNGRLLYFQGNPFFLLRARTPLSDAVRTDGFWMLFVFGCGMLCITFCLQTAKPPLRTQHRMHAAALLPYCFFAALLGMLPQYIRYAGIPVLLFGILIPWATVLLRGCISMKTKRRKTA